MLFNSLLESIWIICVYVSVSHLTSRCISRNTGPPFFVFIKTSSCVTRVHKLMQLDSSWDHATSLTGPYRLLSYLRLVRLSLLSAATAFLR